MRNDNQLCEVEKVWRYDTEERDWETGDPIMRTRMSESPRRIVFVLRYGVWESHHHHTGCSFDSARFRILRFQGGCSFFFFNSHLFRFWDLGVQYCMLIHIWS